ncbi:MAG: ankyrin repeat protein [Limisphaerales bacterium]|jgi:ankyrin repeat protein
MLGREEAIELLINKEADLGTKDHIGDSPLHLASKAQNYESSEVRYLQIIELLIKSGAEINAKNDEGKTALDVAANEIIAKLFRRHGGKAGEELGVQ